MLNFIGPNIGVCVLVVTCEQAFTNVLNFTALPDFKIMRKAYHNLSKVHLRESLKQNIDI